MSKPEETIRVLKKATCQTLSGKSTLSYHVGADLSADALGITACLTAYSHLSFSGNVFAHTYADHFYRLREFMLDHPEVRAILGATD